MDELRSWWEVPSIAHFCSLFRAAFDLSDFDIEDLEEALLDSEKEGGCEFLVDLVCKLLNGCYGREDICSFNYDLYVKDIIKYKWDSGDNPIREKCTFNELTLREKVEVIHSICEYRLDGEDVMELLKGFDGDSMRVEPLGKDKEGGLYWYFYGSRLYKEDPEPKKELTKEQKKKIEKEKRKEQQQRKKLEKKLEKEQKKKDKIERKIARRVERKKLLEMKKREEEEESQGKRRRSGRIQKKQELQLMESSESSSEESPESESETEESSSESEEEERDEEESNSDTEIEEQLVMETKPQKKELKKEAPAKGKKTTEKPAPVEKKAGKRQPPKKKKVETKKIQEEEKPESTRRSGRLSEKRKNKPVKDESDNEDDVSDAHHSDSDDDTKSVQSEVSRKSSRSEISSRSDSVKKELPKRSVRSNRKHCEPEEKEEKSKTDAETLDRPRRSGRKISKEPDKIGISNKSNVNEKKKGDGSDTDGTENTEEQLDTAAKGKRKLRYSTDSDSKEKLNEKTNKEKDIKTEGTSEKEMDTNGEEKMESSETNGDANCTEELDNEHKDSKEIKQESSDDKDLTDSVSKVKLDDDMVKTEDDSEPKPATDTNCSDTREAKEAVERRNEDVEMADRSSKEAANSEEKEKDETEEEKKVDTPDKDVSPAKPRPKPTPPPKSKTSSRWHLICTTLDDWINLSEWFKESTVRSEKALSKVIEEDFLPVLPEIIETREKEKARRQRENELRKSARITQKQKEKMEQEKILAEAAAEEDKARKEAEEERRLKEEQQRLEEENRLREERVKAREERAKRLSMREERARLMAEGKEIPPELIYTGLPAQRYKDDFDSDESRTDLLDDESFQALTKVIDGMKNHADCWPFLEPVTEDQAPGYHDVIKRPMDISKIEKKVELREYRTQHHFLSDFRLMFNNCRRFNGPESDFTSCAKTMEKVLKKLVKRHLLEESTDAYYNDEDFTAGGVKTTGTGTEKKYRPKRQAGTKALQTVHDALKSDQESSSDEDSRIEPLKKRKPLEVSPSVNSLLLQEMIEFKRKRAEQQRAEAHLSPQKPSTTQGIMIMPREEIPTDGVLTLAASREIKWKINPNTVTMAPKLPSSQTVVKTPGGIAKSLPSESFRGRPPNPNSVGIPTILNTSGHPPNTNSVRQPNTVNVVHKKAAGLAPGQKIIKILASAPGTGITAVRQTAESVKVSSDGYLILNGKPTTIKVTQNTKIVIQPQGAASTPESSTESGAAGDPLGKELIIKKIPTPVGLIPLSDAEAGVSTTMHVVDNSKSVMSPTAGNMTAQNPGSLTITAQHGPAMQNRNSLANRQPGGAAQPAIQTAGPNMTPEQLDAKRRQYDMAQRLLAAKRRQLMQNGPVNQKMARLDPNVSQTNPSPNNAVQEQGKGVHSNMPSVNTVSSNVLQNVNISNDILDSYYSVMNEASKQRPVTNSSANIVQQNSLPNSLQHNISANNVQPTSLGNSVQPNMLNNMQPNSVQVNRLANNVQPNSLQQPNRLSNSVQQVAVRNTPVNINRLLQSTSVTSNIPAAVSVSSDVNNSDNQSVKTMSLSALTTALARSIAAGKFQLQKETTNPEKPVSRIGDLTCRVNPNQLTSQNQSNLSNSSGNSVVIDLDNEGEISMKPERVSDQTQYVTQASQPQTFINPQCQPRTQPSSVTAAVADLIKSSVINNPATITNLLTTDAARLQNPNPQISNVANVQNQLQVSQTDIRPIEALFTAQTSPVVLSPTKSFANNQNISQNVASYSNLNVSPAKSDRQNLFDAFESAKSVRSDDFGFASLSEQPEKTPVKLQPGQSLTMKGKGKEFKGSPLNTSVMEALKSKLSPGKHPTNPAIPTVAANFFQQQDTPSGQPSQCVEEDPLPCSVSIVCSPREPSNAQYISPKAADLSTTSAQDRNFANSVCSAKNFAAEAEITNPHSGTELTHAQTKVHDANFKFENQDADHDKMIVKRDTATKLEPENSVHASDIKNSMKLDLSCPEVYMNKQKEPAMILTVRTDVETFASLKPPDGTENLVPESSLETNMQSSPSYFQILDKKTACIRDSGIQVVNDTNIDTTDISKVMNEVHAINASELETDDKSNYTENVDTLDTALNCRMKPASNIEFEKRVGQNSIRNNGNLMQPMLTNQFDQDQKEICNDLHLDTLNEMQCGCNPKTVSPELRKQDLKEAAEGLLELPVEKVCPTSVQVSTIKQGKQTDESNNTTELQSVINLSVNSTNTSEKPVASSSASHLYDLIKKTSGKKVRKAKQQDPGKRRLDSKIVKPKEAIVQKLMRLDEMVKRQIWHLKSPEELGKRGESSKQMNEESRVPVSESKIRIKSHRNDASLEKLVSGSENSLYSRYYNKRMPDVLEQSGSSKVLSVRTNQKASANRSEVDNTKKEVKHKKMFPLIDEVPAKMYKLRGVRSDSALGTALDTVVVDDKKSGFRSGETREKTKRPHPSSPVKKACKHLKLKAVQSDSAVNYSKSNLEELNSRNVEEEMNCPLVNIEKGDRKMKVKSIPYSKHLSDRERVKKSVKCIEEKPVTFKINRAKSNSHSDSSEYRCRRALNFPDSVCVEGRREVMSPTLIENEHVNIVCSSPSPSCLTQFIGSGDINNDNECSASASLPLAEHNFMDNVTVLPDFVGDSDLKNIENDIFELQEQYLNPTDQTSPLPAFSTIDSRLGVQEQTQGTYLGGQPIYRSESEDLKQKQKVSITIAEDTLDRNWQRQISQTHENVSNKVIVQSLPHATLLGSPDSYSAITPQKTAEINPFSISQKSPSITPDFTNQTKTIENIFASGGSNVAPLSTVDALAKYIASNPGQQNLVGNEHNLVGSGGNQLAPSGSKQTSITQNLLNTAEYLGSINVVPGSNTSHSVTDYQKLNHSEQTAVTDSERLRQLEAMFLKGVPTVTQPTLQQLVNAQTSVSDGNIQPASTRQDVPNMEQSST